jgi:NTP pyrophosphatase (non-canonical NTP hydrolase)
MNKNEHLLTCLAEECAEIQQAVSKALRFGLKGGYPGTDRTNADDIAAEITDLMAVISMCCDAKIIDEPVASKNAFDAKKTKVLHYMEYAESVGTLTTI